MWKQSHPQAPGMSTGKGVRIKGEESLTLALPFTLCDTRLSRTVQPRREERLPALLEVSPGSKVLGVSGVTCVCTMQPAVADGDLCLTCPPWLIVSCPLLLVCVSQESGAPLWYYAPKLLALGVVSSR